MDLELKIQAVQPENTTLNKYSIAHQFPRVNDDLLNKRGQLFVCMYISSSDAFDLRAATKLFIDHINESYYVVNEYSPLKNLERVFKSGINLLENFRSKNDEHILGDPTNNTRISATLGLVWNRVFYSINYGNNANYLIRGAGSRDLNLEESNQLFTTNSLILENDDVIILGTDEFKKLFPVKNIVENLTGISSRINNSEEKDLISMIILKINDRTDTRKRKTRTPLELHNLIFVYFLNLKNKLKQEKSLSDEFKVYQSKKTTPISSISGIQSSNEPSVSIRSSRPLRLSTPKRYPLFNLVLGFSIVIGLLIGAIALYKFSTANTKQSDSQRSESSSTRENIVVDNNEADTSMSQIKADLLLTSKEIPNESEISVFDMFGTDQIVFYSENNKSLNLYNTTKKDNVVVEDNISGIEQVRCTDKFCFAVTKELVLVFDPTTPNKVDKYAYALEEPAIDVGYFGSSGYLLTRNQIYSFRFGDVNPTFTPWVTSSESLSNALFMLINSDVYILDGNITKKFTSGRRQTFNLAQDNLNLSKLLYADRTRLYAFSSTNSKIYTINLTNNQVLSEIDLRQQGFTDIITPLDIAVTKGKTPTIIVKYDNQFFKVSL